MKISWKIQGPWQHTVIFKSLKLPIKKKNKQLFWSILAGMQLFVIVLSWRLQIVKFPSVAPSINACSKEWRTKLSVHITMKHFKLMKNFQFSEEWMTKIWQCFRRKNKLYNKIVKIWAGLKNNNTLSYTTRITNKNNLPLSSSVKKHVS